MTLNKGYDMEEIDKRTGIKRNVIDEIIQLSKTYDVDKTILFGSRARGDYSKRSDIDLAIVGGNSVEFILGVEETSTLLSFDVVDMNKHIASELEDSINREGVVIYEKV